MSSSVDHTNADSFVCIFLTHGDDDGLLYAYDGSVNLQELLDEFRGNKCRSLIGKPKIFIIQACRGRELEVGVCETDGGIEDTDAKSAFGVADALADAGTRTTLPAGADFIVCYSVVGGYFSFRDTVSGSWYIQALCQALASYATNLEFTLLLTLVNRMVAEKCVKRSADPRMLGRKQMPCFVSMLTKQLMLTPKRYTGRRDIKK
ncbi:caspase-6-like [Amphiura filiformis]|uniref:caspase-6-like n=1 Tax=Amphiura filiformis TaxID=82378 RepID=UPI003B21F66B